MEPFGAGGRFILDSCTSRKAGGRSVFISYPSLLRDKADAQQMGREGLQGQGAAQALSRSRCGGVGVGGQQRQLRDRDRRGSWREKAGCLCTREACVGRSERGKFAADARGLGP